MINFDDLAQVIFSNFTSAAGTLAETKFALRQVENEEEKQRLQGRMHQETMWFNKASMLAKMYADEQMQQRHEDTAALQTRLQDWREGEVGRTDEKRVKDAKSEVAVAVAKKEDEEKIKADAAEKKREQAEKDREELKQSYIRLGMSEEEAEVASSEKVPDAVESKIATQAMNKMQLRKMYPDKSEAEINEIYQRIYVPKSEAELSESVGFQRELADIDRMEAEGTIDAETADLLRKGVHRRIAGTGSSTDATQRKLDAIDAEYGSEGRTPDPEKHRQARDKALGATAPAGAKDDEDKSKTAWLDEFGHGTANRDLLERIAINVPTEAADKDLIRSFGAILAGSTGPDDIDEDRKRAVAGRAELYLQGNRPEGEAAVKLNQAQDFTLAEMGGLWEDLQLMDEDSFGKIDEAIERIAQGAGTTSDIALTRFDSKIKALINRWIRVESGAAITPDEITFLKELMPSIGNKWHINMEVLRTIGGIFQRSKQREYNLHFGNEWGAAIGEIQLEAANDMLEEINKKHPTGAQTAKKISDDFRNK